MPLEQAISSAPPGFEHVGARLLADIATLPCDLYIWRGPRPVLYAAGGGDLRKVVARTQHGMSFLVRDVDSDLLRGALAASLPDVLENRGVPALDRSKTAYSIAAKVLAPIFGHDRALDHDRLMLAQQTIDTITGCLLGDADLVWAMVATMPRQIAAHTHALNTAVYGIALALAMRLGNAAQIEDVARGALLHDLGKARVPKAILDKPASLNEAEWQVMRGHVKAGYEMVIRALGYAPPYAHIIAEHHERCDGSGYPGNRLPHQVALDSQLVAVVDAFDALTSRRPYKAAVSAFEALRVMRVTMRGQFNDELIREFIKLLGGWSSLNEDLSAALRGAG